MCEICYSYEGHLSGCPYYQEPEEYDGQSCDDYIDEQIEEAEHGR